MCFDRCFRLIFLAVVVSLVLLVTSSVCLAVVMWTANGVEIRGAGLTGDAQGPQAVADGAGGAIVTWQDSRSGKYDIFTQKVDSSGTPKWAANGVDVRGTGVIVSSSGTGQQLAADGSGGAIVTWHDSRSGWPEIYAQKVDSSGNLQWAANGQKIKASLHTNGLVYPNIAPAPGGGAVITWWEYDYATGSKYAILAQKVDSSGTSQWNTNGIEIRGQALAGDIRYPQITPDGAGGAIVAWQDSRSGKYDIYAQRVDSAGIPQWTPNGVEIRGAVLTGDAWITDITSDGLGGAFISWYDRRSGSQYDVFAQSVDSSGTPRWALNGLNIRGEGVARGAGAPRLAADGSGGVLATWTDYRNDTYGIGDSDVFAQRFNSAGTPLWSANGVAISTGPNATYSPRLTSDGAGGSVIAWYEYSAGRYIILAQKVDSSGVPLWTANGEEVRGTGVAGDALGPDIAPDGSGGAIVAWQDKRSGRSDIFTQRLSDPPVVPVVTAMSPDSSSNLWAVNVTISGQHFKQGASARLVKGTTVIDATGITVVSDTSITCNFNVSGQPLGKYDVIVKNPDNQEGKLAGGFSVTDACGQGGGASIAVLAGIMGLLSVAGLGSRLSRRRGRSQWD